jgi:hypothetical protein
MSVIATGSSNGLFVKDLDDVLGIGATINSAGVFQASTGPEIRRVTGNPNATISDFGGSLALDVTNGVAYVNTSTTNVAGTSWAVLAANGSGYSSAVAKAFALTASIPDQGENSNAVITPAGVQLTLAAGSLAAGSTIQVRFAANMNQGAANTVVLTVNLGATNLVTTGAIGFGNNTALVFDFNCTIRGTTAASSIQGESSTASFSTQLVSANTINLAAANALTFTLQFNASQVGTNMDINQYEIYVAR